MVVVSVTIVPKSSRSDSACRVRVEDGPVVSSSYEGRDPEPGVSDEGWKGVNPPSTFTGISFQILRGAGPSSTQVETFGVSELFSYSSSVPVNS